MQYWFIEKATKSTQPAIKAPLKRSIFEELILFKSAEFLKK